MPNDNFGGVDEEGRLVFRAKGRVNGSPIASQEIKSAGKVYINCWGLLGYLPVSFIETWRIMSCHSFQEQACSTELKGCQGS